MSKWFGQVGFVITEETRPGVFKPKTVERNYYGDVLSNRTRFATNPNSTNDNVVISDEISILADPFANENIQSLRFVTHMGAKWKVTAIRTEYPRVILSIGEVWNEEG